MARSILATFPSTTKAEAAREALRRAGFRHTQIDRASEYPTPPGETADEELNNPIAGQADTLTGLSVYSADHHMSPGARPLVAADPSVSGLATGDEKVGGRNVLLTVVTEDRLVEKACRIIREHGGRV